MHGVMRAGSLLADRYRLDSPIGRGAMGIVWRGRDELLERDVAVKEVRVPAGRVAVLDLLVSLATSAGEQPYALSMSAPRPDAPAAAQVFQEMLQTFQPAS